MFRTLTDPARRDARRPALALAAATLALGAPLSGQCLVETLSGATPVGSVVCAGEGTYAVASADRLTVEYSRLGADGYEVVPGAVTLAAGSEARSMDTLLFSDGDEVVAIGSTFSTFFQTAIYDVITGVSIPVFFSGTEPVVSLTEHDGAAWMAVGFPGEGVAGAGQTHIYRRELGSPSWIQWAVFSSPDSSPGDMFGADVSIQGDTLAVTAPGEDGAGVDRGAVYFYRWNGTDWAFSNSAYGTTDNDPSYTSVACYDGEILVGSPSYDEAPDVDNGRIDFWEWDGSSYTFRGFFFSLAGNTRMGGSVDLDGLACVVSTDAGFAFSFEKDVSTGWSFAGTVNLPTASGAVDDVAIDSSANALAPASRMFVGDTGHDTGAGAVHLYSLGSSTVTDLGNGLAGFLGQTPNLAVTNDVCAFGGTVDFNLSLMRPTSVFYLFIGVSELNAPFKGGVLVPSALLVLDPLPTGFGSLPFSLDVEYGIAGLSLILQAWILDPDAVLGASATNGLRVDFGS